MLILIVFLPLFGFLSGSLFGRFLGFGSCVITTSSIILSFLLSIVLFYDVAKVGTWIASDSININWCFLFDSLTCVMLLVVTFISSLVHLYSSEYMEHDPHLPKFMYYLSLLTFSILTLMTCFDFLMFLRPTILKN